MKKQAWKLHRQRRRLKTQTKDTEAQTKDTDKRHRQKTQTKDTDKRHRQKTQTKDTDKRHRQKTKDTCRVTNPPFLSCTLWVDIANRNRHIGVSLSPAPRTTRYSMTSLWPYHAADIKAVHPPIPFSLTFAPSPCAEDGERWMTAGQGYIRFILHNRCMASSRRCEYNIHEMHNMSWLRVVFHAHGDSD
jgi:hypothetical protein